MRNIWTISRRELGAYFVSPIAYAIIAAFLVFSGVLFALYLNQREASLRGWISTMLFLAVFIAPMITMRVLSEEKQTGTIELLLTSPIRDGELVLGKFFAALGVWIVMMALTLVYVVVLRLFGDPDMVIIAAGYFALVLFGSAAVAIGVLTSAISPNQIIAVFTSFFIMLVLWIIGFVGQLAGGATSPVSGVLSYLSIFDHTNDMVKGVLDSKDVVFYLSFIFLGLFLTGRSLESLRWRA